MKPSAGLCLAAALAVSVSANGAPPPPAEPPVLVGHLECGGAQLTSRTQYLDVPDHDRQVLAQTLELTAAGSRVMKLPHDGRSFKQPFAKRTAVLDASATGWACVDADDGGHYVYVIYTCSESPLRPHCVGTEREWVRLFDTAGAPMTAHFPRSGPRLPALMKKLGLGRYLAEGVNLKDVTEP